MTIPAVLTGEGTAGARGALLLLLLVLLVLLVLLLARVAGEGRRGVVPAEKERVSASEGSNTSAGLALKSEGRRRERRKRTPRHAPS